MHLKIRPIPEARVAASVIMKNNFKRLSIQNTGLLVVDIQERLLPAMHEKERVAQNALRLVKGAGILGLPTRVTEQYRKGLGGTIPELAASMAHFNPIEKMTFSALQAGDLLKALQNSGIENVLLCGIECHVCVCMTCLDLIANGFHPFVIADAVSSRTSENCSLGIDRMRQAGATIVSTEMVLFELLERADAPAFKQILNLVK